ncbi:MAG: MCP four helix bundle domain-containing protein, partial [Planctomycetota bacterium]
MRNATLGTKIALGFGLVMLIALVLGAMGYYQASTSSRTILELSGDRLPAVESLLALKEAVPTIKCAQRTLMDPTIKPDVRKRQYEFFQKAEKTYAESAKTFEGVSKTAGEESTWKEFVAAWGEWQAANAEFVRQVKSVEKLDLGDPTVLLARINRFRGDHYLAESKVQGMLASHKVYQGGEDPKACNFGKWLGVFVTENPEFATIIKDASAWHDKFHAPVASIKKAVAAGQFDDAHKLFEDQMIPSAQQVFVRFDAVDQFVQTAEATWDKARQQAMVVAR